MRVMLVSTYELGHQPLGLAAPAAALRAAGHDVRAVDVAVEPLDDAATAWAEAVAVSVPMHTAMRLAREIARRLRAERPGLPICLYGLYATVSTEDTLGVLADHLIAGEYERELVAWADGGARPAAVPVVDLGRGAGAAAPARDLLKPLDAYARLALGDERRLAGYVEASRGCVHRCRHCPIPPVYDGRIRIVPRETVLADVDHLVDLGARHITFGDPDFLNGRRHSLEIVRALHARHPQLTYDCTTKVEHILEFPDVWPELRATGCLFVVTALESVTDAILARLDKGHTTADARAAIDLLRRHGIEPRPTFVPFTPWTRPADVADLLDFVAAADLVPNVDPVQYTIRLLLPAGSLLVEHPDTLAHLRGYDGERLTWRWESADPASDALQLRLADLVERGLAAGDDEHALFAGVCEEVAVAAGRPTGAGPQARGGERPRLTESWFCCAEPTEGQLGRSRCAAPAEDATRFAAPAAG